MEIVFRQFNPSEPVPSGELHLRPLNPGKQYDALAAIALDDGPAGFVHGEGEIRRVVVRLDPNLDDMLAVFVLEELLNNRPKPPKALAHYADALSKGFRPSTTIPYYDSPHAIFRAIRNQANEKPDDGLDDPAVAGKFLTGWFKMADKFRDVLQAGQNPLERFAEPYEFISERQFLQKDESIYQRDLKKGRRFWIRLPGKDEPIPGLWLCKPEATLFEQWARADQSASGGAGYRFLAISGLDRPWTFTTNPGEGLKINELAAKLEQAEQKQEAIRQAAQKNQEPESAKAEGKRDPVEDPWYDGGRRHQHTLVGAPNAGTKLSNLQVMTVLYRWGKCRTIRERQVAPPRRKMSKLVIASLSSLAAFALLVGAVILIWQIWPGPNPRTDPSTTPKQITNGTGNTTHPVTNGSGLPITNDPPPDGLKWKKIVPPKSSENRYQFDIESDEYKDVSVPWRVYYRVKVNGAIDTPTVEVTEPNGTKKTLIIENKKSGKQTSNQSCTLPPRQKPDQALQFKVDAPPDMPAQTVLTFEWARDKSKERHLFLQSIGVSKYPGGLNLPNPLKTGAASAQAIDDKFKEGRLFIQVHRREPFGNDPGSLLLDENATKQHINDALPAMIRQIRNFNDQSADVPKFALIYFCGHGDLEQNDRFVFRAVDTSASANDANSLRVRELEDFIKSLKELNCKAIFIFDCCHSGKAVDEFPSPKDVFDPICIAPCEAPELEQEFSDEKIPEKYRRTVLATALLNLMDPSNSDGPDGKFDTSLFTLLKIKGLDKHNGPINYEEALGFLEVRVNDLTQQFMLRKQTVRSEAKKPKDFPFFWPD
jgi:hypothetical protein